MEADSQRQSRLQRLLGGAPLAELRERLRARYERGKPAGPFTMTQLNDIERSALEGLLGRRSKLADSMRVSTAELDAALASAGLAPDLRRALEALDGPIENSAAARVALSQDWERVLSSIVEPRLHVFSNTAQGRSLIKRLGREPNAAQAMLRSAAGVLQHLPAQGIPLAQFAADTLGDAHGLDAGSGLATLVLAVIAPAPDSADDPEGARARSRWAQVGVLMHELARPALVLNLPAMADTPAAQLAGLAKNLGEPIHLSLRVLLRQPPRWDVDGRVVWVCENPTIVTLAADRLGRRCAPLVCTDGMPSASQRTLLQQLNAARARLRYHGDFDWDGLRIANFILRSFGAEPWRMSADDYRGAAGDRGRLLGPDATDALWDDALRPAMQAQGIALDEEAVAAALIADLQDPAAYSRQ